MKRIVIKVFVACLIACFVSALHAQDIRVKLDVANATTQAVYIQQAHLEDAQLNKTHRIDLSSAGYAEFIYPIEGATFVEFNYDGYIIPVYLDSKSGLTISFNGQNVASTLQFSGVGSEDNNFIAAFDKLSEGSAKVTTDCAYLDIVFSKIMSQNGQYVPVSDFTASLVKRYNAQRNLLAQYRSSISQKVHDFYSTKAKYDKEADKLSWILPRVNQLDQKGIEAAKSQLGLGNGLTWSDASLINHPSYKNALKALAIYNYLPNDPFKNRSYTKIYPLIEQHLSGEARCYMTTHLLIKVYEKSGASELGRSKIGDLQNTCPQYTEAVMQMYGGDISGVENISAGDIDMIDKMGNLVSLTDYNGKVVYLSFWASWCKPCIAGFKKSKDIRQKLQDMGVVLVNISIDKEEEAWRDAMIRHNPLGVNTWAISLQDLAKDYDISAIPLYHIINKQGKFAYLSDQESRDIVDEFRTLVKN